MGTPHEAICQARVGSVLKGKWKLERILGVGGMAAVYVGVHKIGRRDAIKILHPEIARQSDLKKRFEIEASATNRFRHTGAVEIRDYDVSEDGCPFLVMEMLEGESLGERARRLGQIEEPDVLRFVDELLDVLAAAHKEGIVHRDIKLDNVFVQSDGHVKVLDFGIARVRSSSQITMAGTRLGTTAYMPPEQIRGLEVDGRADLFAVGATMFRLLAKRRIHEAPTDSAMVIRMSSEPAPRLLDVAPAVSPNVAAIVDRALAFKADDRYPNALTMQGDVRSVREGQPPAFAIGRASNMPALGGRAFEPTGVAPSSPHAAPTNAMASFEPTNATPAAVRARSGASRADAVSAPGTPPPDAIAAGYPSFAAPPSAPSGPSPVDLTRREPVSPTRAPTQGVSTLPSEAPPLAPTPPMRVDAIAAPPFPSTLPSGPSSVAIMAAPPAGSRGVGHTQQIAQPADATSIAAPFAAAALAPVAPVRAGATIPTGYPNIPHAPGPPSGVQPTLPPEHTSAAGWVASTSVAPIASYSPVAHVPPKKTSGGLVALLLVGAVVVLGAGGFLLYMGSSSASSERHGADDERTDPTSSLKKSSTGTSDVPSAAPSSKANAPPESTGTPIPPGTPSPPTPSGAPQVDIPPRPPSTQANPSTPPPPKVNPPPPAKPPPQPPPAPPGPGGKKKKNDDKHH